MASLIKIKRSAITSIPVSLAEGELAYSELSKQLFIGTNAGADIEILGGKKFTDLLDHTPGVLTASSALIVDADSKLDHLIVDNIDLNGNTVSTTNANGDLVLAPNGTGAVDAKALKLNGGATVVTAITDDGTLAGVAATDLATARATKEYIDSVATGLTLKAPAKAATAGVNVDLASAGDPNPIDGVTLSNGDRVLLKDQTDLTENGIYVATTANDPTTWVRASDMDEPSEVVAGTFVFVEEGTVNDNTGWVVVSDNPITIGSDDIVFGQFSGAGSITAGDGLTKTGNTLSVNAADIAGAGLEVTSNNLNVNVDDVTIEVGVDGLNVKANGITSAEILLGNNTALRGRNAADDADVNLISINASDEVVVTGLKAPTADSDAATKEYVDDAIAGGSVDPNALAGAGLVVNGAALDVNVDDATLEIATDVVQVKADGIDGTHVRLDNNQALRARNVGNTADVDLIKLNASDEVVITGLAAPTVDADAATKEYVDDMTVEVDDVTIGIDGSMIISVKADGVDGTHIQLNNNQALRSRNQADSADVNLISLNTSDEVVVTGLRAPTVDSDAATKEYVDDAVAGATVDPTDLAGAGLVPNGSVLDVNVDDITIEINTDTVRVKADGIDGTHVRLDNNQALRARNVGDDADISLISLNTSNEVVVTGLKAPTADSDAATKEYVDDAIAGVGGVTDLDDLSDVTITTPSSGQILVNNGAGQFANVSLSGDVTMDNTGAVTIGAGAVENSMLANSTLSLAGDTGTDSVALGETLTFAGTNGIEIDVDTNTITVDLTEVDGGSF